MFSVMAKLKFSPGVHKLFCVGRHIQYFLQQTVWVGKFALFDLKLCSN